jgi:hypothetical protein
MSTPTTPLPFPQLTELQLNIMKMIAIYNVFVAVPAVEGDRDFDRRADKYRQCLQLVEWGLLEPYVDEIAAESLKQVKEQTGREVHALTFTQLGEAMFGMSAVDRVKELTN